MQTEVPTVFAGGDAWRGAATAVEAIRDGRFAARGIHLLLGGESVEMPENWLKTPPTLGGIGPRAQIEPIERVKIRELPVADRLVGFDEVELGLTEEMAKRESERCLQCGLVCFRGWREDAS